MSIAEQFESKLESGQLAKPIPRWQVILKRACIWIALAVLAFLGTLSSGIAIWFAFDPTKLLSENRFFEDLILVLPIFWFVLSLLCGLFAIWIFTKSSRGYRFRLAAVGISCLVAFVALGVAMAMAGISDKAEEMAAAHIPSYFKMTQPLMVKRLMRPQEGKIIGKVENAGTSTMTVIDPSGKAWKIEGSRAGFMLKQFKSGNCVRISGETATGTGELRAKSINQCPRGLRLRPVKALLK